MRDRPDQESSLTAALNSAISSTERSVAPIGWHTAKSGLGGEVRGSENLKCVGPVELKSLSEGVHQHVANVQVDVAHVGDIGA